MREIEETLSENELLGKLYDALSALPEREQDVIVYRFGFDQDGVVRTLREVGEILGMSPEHVRQIEARALRKLRHPRHGLGSFFFRVKRPSCSNNLTLPWPWRIKTWAKNEYVMVCWATNMENDKLYALKVDLGK